ncbi:erlin-2-like isoform X2 [Quercus lobata]|uniref:erlin-2-like isoform X2 n=1 Tax=Quercus lobata TaxID=97700 RepID=UPI0012458850|nr:erlin-2-like isoform X2 [Quercus lobata]
MDTHQPRPATPLSPHGGGGGGGFSAILTVFLSFIAIFAMIVIPSSSTIRNGFSILHQVPEGHVGVYWRGGALLKTITDPGFHLKLPFITHYEPVQVTLQTDQVRDIPCGTKGGVMINFEKIEIDEKMKDALQGDCTRYAPGIEIISVRVTKPKIPESIRRNFEQMEEERTKVLIAIEKQRVVEKEAETNKKMAISEAEKVANVSKILMEQKLMEKDSVRKQQEIENQIYMARQKSLADADFYRLLKEAEANKLKLTPQFLELKFIEAIADNTKIFFGEKIPNMFLDQRLLGNFLQQLSRNVSEEEKSTA